MDVRQTIGWNLRALRVERGLSQERLSLLSGVDRSYVGRIERGSENVTVNSLEALSSALEAHVSQLFAKVDEKAGKPKGLPSGQKPKAGR